MEKILYATGHAVGSFNGKIVEKLDSGYIAKYRDTLIQIQKKDEWKYGGQSALFQGRYNSEPEEFYAAVNAVCADGDKGCLYTVIAGEVSGIISKNYETGHENHIYHSNKYKFYSAQNCPAANQIVLSIAENDNTKSVAVYDRNSNDLRFLTSGDAVDDNPFLDEAAEVIYYDSRGLGLNTRMEIVSVGSASIFKTSLNGETCDEVLAEHGYDLLCPKLDAAGNLYYIRRPYKNKARRGDSNLFVDILLLPFRLAANLIRGLMFLSKLGTKNKERKNINTFGNNPSVQKELSDFDLYVYGELINAQKDEEANSKHEKTAGFAPKNYELFRLKPDGNKELLRRGVLSYDIDTSGTLYYSNGRYVFKAEESGDKVVLKDKIILNIKVH